MDAVSSTLKIIVKEKKIETAFVFSVFTIVFGCFCIPIIIYAVSNDPSTSSLGLEVEFDVDVDNCSQQVPVPMSNGSQLISPYNGTCSLYDGICSTHLQTLAGVGNTVTTQSHNGITEEQVLDFLNLLQGFSGLISEECSAAVVPFICQYAYPPCDGNGSLLLITQEQCVDIRDDVCANEWRIAMVTDQGSLLPVCEAFDDGDDSSSVATSNVSEPLMCHYQFREYCGICLPLCGMFSQYPDDVKIAQRSVIILSAVLELIGGIIVLIAASVRRKMMLVFPQVLAMYTTVGAVVIAIFTIISYIGGQERLYCSHDTLHLSILEPSVFTQISGFAFQFCLLFMAITWFLHLFHLFLGIQFPFWSRFLSEKKWKMRLHIVELISAIFLSGVAPTAFVSTSEYTLRRFPPLFALPSSKVAFYTIVLPLTIILAVGVNLAFLSFWTVHKTTGLFKKEKSIWFVSFSVPEVKILLLLSYFIVFGITSLVNFAISINEANPFLDDLFRYFECNLFGSDPKCEDIRQDFEKHLNPGFSGTTYFLLALITWVHLLFAIQAQDVKKIVKSVINRYHSTLKFSSQETATSSIKTSPA